MSRLALAGLAAACGLAAGFAVGLAYDSGGWATLTFALVLALAVLIDRIGHLARPPPRSPGGGAA